MNYDEIATPATTVSLFVIASVSEAIYVFS